MHVINIGSWVHVHAIRSDSGTTVVSPIDPVSKDYPLVRCRVTGIDVCGIKGCYTLAYEDGHPVGLPFYERMFVFLEG